MLVLNHTKEDPLQRDSHPISGAIPIHIPYDGQDRNAYKQFCYFVVWNFKILIDQ